MSALEKIVRPFQTGDVFTARVLAPNPLPNASEPQPNVVITWKGSAEAKYEEEPGPGQLGYTAEWEEDKSRRQTETVRVEQDGKPENFVELERIKQMVIRNKQTREEIPIKMDWT